MVIAECHFSVSVEVTTADCFFSDILCQLSVVLQSNTTELCSTVDVLLGIDEIQKSILVLKLFIDFFQFGTGLHHVFFIGK